MTARAGAGAAHSACNRAAIRARDALVLPIVAIPGRNGVGGPRIARTLNAALDPPPPPVPCRAWAHERVLAGPDGGVLRGAAFGRWRHSLLAEGAP